MVPNSCQQTRFSSEIAEGSSNNWHSLFITSDMFGRDTGSTRNIERISSSKDAE